MRSWTTILLFIIFSCASTRAPAAETGRQFEAEVGVGQLDEDVLLTARLGFLWFDEVAAVGCRDAENPRCIAPIRAALGLPMRLELVDDSPADDELIRAEDWDDPGDFFRIVRFLQYGERYQPLYARTGELGSIVLGHGTIANGYLNTITTGDFSPGAEVAANTTHGGIHVFLDDYTRPRVFGLRGHVRPFAKPDEFGTRGFWHRFAIGVSAVSDFAAPTLVASGDPVRGEPVVTEASPFTVAGLDLELVPVDNDRVEVVTYADVNLAQGAGAHLGATLRVAITDELSASLRAEGRIVGSKYIPDFFGPLYRVERYQFSGWGAPSSAPKTRVAASLNDTRYGGYGQLNVAWRELVNVSLAGSDHTGNGDTSAWVRVALTPPGPVSIAAYWARLNTDTGDLFTLDGALMATEARVTIWGPLYAHGRYDRLYRLGNSGSYTPAIEWNAGFGAALPF